MIVDSIQAICFRSAQFENGWTGLLCMVILRDFNLMYLAIVEDFVDVYGDCFVNGRCCHLHMLYPRFVQVAICRTVSRNPTACARNSDSGRPDSSGMCAKLRFRPCTFGMA